MIYRLEKDFPNDMGVPDDACRGVRTARTVKAIVDSLMVEEAASIDSHRICRLLPLSGIALLESFDLLINLIITKVVSPHNLTSPGYR